MKTEDLISALSVNAGASAPARPSRGLLSAAGFGLAVGAALLVAASGVRPDIGVSLPAVFAKAAFSATLAAAALPLSARLMRPGQPLGGRLAAAGVVIAASLAIAAIALLGEAPERRLEAWTGGGFPWCLVLIPLLAAPAAAALVWLARDFAPTRLAHAGAAIGGFAGGLGAMLYALVCPVDSIAFVTTWYTVAIALCAAIGAIFGGRLLRW